MTSNLYAKRMVSVGYFTVLCMVIIILKTPCHANMADTSCCDTLSVLSAQKNPSAESPAGDTTYYWPFPDSFNVYQIALKKNVVRSDSQVSAAMVPAKPESLPPVNIPWWQWPFVLRDDRSVAAPSAPLWIETGSEGVRQFDEDNTPQGYIQVALGKRFFKTIPVDVYAKLKYSRDLSGVSWNNRGDLGIGVRSKPFQNLPLTFYAEAITGAYFNVQQASQRYSLVVDSLQALEDSLLSLNEKELYNPTGPLTEYQIGMLFFNAWGPLADSVLSEAFKFPLRWYAQLYAECIYSNLQQSVGMAHIASGIVDFSDSAVVEADLILYANPKVGCVVAEGWPGKLSASAVGYAWIDTRNNWWYNKAMIGPALTYEPFREVDLAFEVSYMLGGYYGIQRPESPNPYPRGIATWRLSFMFDYSVGF